MSPGTRRGNTEVLSAIATITGQSSESVAAAFHAAKQAHPDGRHASQQELRRALNRVRTRLNSTCG
jgi:hypothetical protein